MKENLVCNLCHGSSIKNLYALDRLTICQCADCGLVFRNVILDDSEISKMYSADYFVSQQARYFSDRRVVFAEKIKVIKSIYNKRVGKLLDIGCAIGDFIDIAKSAGLEASGQDISEYAGEVCRKRGLNVFIGQLKAARFPDNNFDIITAWDMLNHDENPQGLLEEVFRILKKDGILAVQVNSIDSFVYRLAHWVYAATKGIIKFPIQTGYPVHQSTFYNAQTLRKAMLAAGFSELRYDRDKFINQQSSVLEKGFMAKAAFYFINTVGNMVGLPISLVMYGRKLNPILPK